MNPLIAFTQRNLFFVSFLLLLVPATPYAQLSANFTMDRSGGCSPLSVSFFNQSSGASANAVYGWSFGNDNTSSCLPIS
ncbi:MAG: hypothetical protein ACXWWC_08240 [Chitinophagaceae bacterium]